MKIALLSFHNAYNYGAALQAYALQEYVGSLGYTCEYINYVNSSRKHSYDMDYQIKKAIHDKKIKQGIKLVLGKPFMKKRGVNFEQFYANNLCKTEKLYTCSHEAYELNNQYDKFIVGSDQVWNPKNNGGDYAFLLDFVNEEKKRIAYSSSFGISEVPLEYRDRYQEEFNKFGYLSSREEMGQKLIKELTGRDTMLVMDPVFLLEKSKWKTIAQKPNNAKKYFFFYTNRDNQVDQFLNMYGKSDNQYHILSSHIGVKDFADRQKKVVFSMAPEEFLGEIANSNLVITASFHCLAFSIIFHKQFVVFLTGDLGKDERVMNLLEITGLKSRVFSNTMTKEEIYTPINYSDVDKRLAEYIADSKSYLKAAIGDDQETILQLINKRKINEDRFCGDFRCTGCTACASICPTDAIRMVRDDEGFLTPQVNEESCVHCGKCHQVCPIFCINRNENSIQKYYAAKNLTEIRKGSSSGGVFTACSDVILERGGLVFAATMDNDFHVVHSMANSKTLRDAMCRTFYVQSELKDTFVLIKAKADIGMSILFVGTPCQVHGLKLFLGKEYDNVYTIDLICHGVPSPGVFEKFIEYLKDKGKLTSFQFRDKSLGWRGYHVSAVINGKKITEKLWLQSFNNLFSHNLINRQSCSVCKYTNYNRFGDITIGDFWGIKKLDPAYYDTLGVSLVLVNTEKGQTLFRETKGLDIKEVRKEQTVQNSLERSQAVPGSRGNVFTLLETKGYEVLIKRYGECNIKGHIKNKIRKLIIK